MRLEKTGSVAPPLNTLSGAPHKGPHSAILLFPTLVRFLLQFGADGRTREVGTCVIYLEVTSSRTRHKSLLMQKRRFCHTLEGGGEWLLQGPKPNPNSLPWAVLQHWPGSLYLVVFVAGLDR